MEMKDLSLQEIEKYGSDVQMDISESMTKLLHDTKSMEDRRKTRGIGKRQVKGENF